MHTTKQVKTLNCAFELRIVPKSTAFTLQSLDAVCSVNTKGFILYTVNS